MESIHSRYSPDKSVRLSGEHLSNAFKGHELNIASTPFVMRRFEQHHDLKDLSVDTAADLIATDSLKLERKEADSALSLPPAAITIFGAAGNLSRKKLIPALYELERDGALHEDTQIIGIDPSANGISGAELVQAIQAEYENDESFDPEALKRLAAKTEVFPFPEGDDDYQVLQARLNKIEYNTDEEMSRLFYLAIPPQITESVITQLGKSERTQEAAEDKAPTRVVMEKPFGHSKETAALLVNTVEEYFEEPQIYRVDHYLAKQAIQNIITFRAHNPIFQNVWNRDHISSVQIEADESIDIDGRTSFFEKTGALRDVVQSHLMHVASILLMPHPSDVKDAEALHEMRQHALDHIEPVPLDRMHEQVIRGQYEGYRDEVGNDTSTTETFTSLKLYSRDEAWEGVPIYLRTGKALDKKNTRVAVNFASKSGAAKDANQLVFSVAPKEGVQLGLGVKEPGYVGETGRTELGFTYTDAFSSYRPSDAYSQVFFDAIRGNRALFPTGDQTMSTWRVMQSVLDGWKNSNGEDLVIYKKGTPGSEVGHVIER